jgi:Ca2+-binding RTX toxin-like protein
MLFVAIRAGVQTLRAAGNNLRMVVVQPLRQAFTIGCSQLTNNKDASIMANYTYGTLPFTSTTFTSPLLGSDDVINANVLLDFTITGNGGHDAVTTGGGNDTITTGSGNDHIDAGNGNNTVNAGIGTNEVTSGSGNDTITTGSGNDTITAGDGNNTVQGGDGTNNVISGNGNDTITTGSGVDNVSSGSGDDIIMTGAGNDFIMGGAGNDIVNAGAGNDMIVTGGGIDLLTGGGGHDTFRYDTLASAQLGADTIFDFNTANPSSAGEGDRLDLRGLVDDFSGVSNKTSLSKLVASGHIDFSAVAGGTVVSYDSNGSAVGGTFGVLVTLMGVPFTTEAAAVSAFADNILV